MTARSPQMMICLPLTCGAFASLRCPLNSKVACRWKSACRIWLRDIILLAPPDLCAHRMHLEDDDVESEQGEEDNLADLLHAVIGDDEDSDEEPEDP